MSDERFEAVDWETVDGRTTLDAGLALQLLPFAVVVAMYVYDHGRDRAFAHGWYPSNLDWLTLFALALFLAGFVVPLARRPDAVRRYWARLREDRAGVAALGVVATMALVAVVQPLLVGRPGVELLRKSQPPVYTTTSTYPCLAGNDIDSCPGTWQHPLGTNPLGQDMIEAIAAATHVSVRFALIVSALVVPIAVGVGVTAGYVGGRVDDLLMRYVDLQQTVPAFLVYIIVGYATSYSLFTIVLVFGLFSWGNVARLVRSEVLQRKEMAFVTAARNAGASHLRIVRRHLLPNVSGTVLTGLTLQIPTLILAEVALSFLAFGDIDRVSFGTLVRQGLGISVWNPGSTTFGIGNAVADVWWMSLFPVLALATIVVSFNVLGDSLRDVLDPRGDG